MNNQKVCIIGVDEYTDIFVKYLKDNNFDLYLIIDSRDEIKKIVIQKYNCFFEHAWDSNLYSDIDITYINNPISNHMMVEILKNKNSLVMDISLGKYFYNQEMLYPYFQYSTFYIFSHVRLDPKINKLKQEIGNPSYIQIRNIGIDKVHSFEIEFDLIYYLTNQKPRYIHSCKNENVISIHLSFMSGLIVNIVKMKNIGCENSNHIHVISGNKTMSIPYSTNRSYVPGMHPFDFNESYYHTDLNWIYNCETALKKSMYNHECIDVEKEEFRF